MAKHLWSCVSEGHCSMFLGVYLDKWFSTGGSQPRSGNLSVAAIFFLDRGFFQAIISNKLHLFNFIFYVLYYEFKFLFGLNSLNSWVFAVSLKLVCSLGELTAIFMSVLNLFHLWEIFLAVEWCDPYCLEMALSPFPDSWAGNNYFCKIIANVFLPSIPSVMSFLICQSSFFLFSHAGKCSLL